MKRIAGVLFGLAVAVGGLSLSACAVSNQVVMPSGQHGYTINCSGAAMTWASCYEKAGEACPQGYDVADKSDEHGGPVVAANRYGLFGAPVMDRTMLIQCK